jgi:hypothetical protein
MRLISMDFVARIATLPVFVIWARNESRLGGNAPEYLGERGEYRLGVFTRGGVR